MQLNEAVSKRVMELLAENEMSQYQLYVKTGLPKSTISNIVKCTYPSVKLRVIHELCQGFGITLEAFFASTIFDENNLEP